MNIYTEQQQVALAFAPKFSGFLSIAGCSYIIFTICTSAKRRARMHYRLIVGMSFMDFFQSLSFFLSTWPSPADTPHIKFAVGNNTTCTIQGFFINFNVGVALYNASLSLYYLLVIKYRFTHDQMKKIEIILHSIPIFHSLITGFVVAIDKAFNNAGYVCYISRFPFGSSKHDATRGQRVGWYLLPQFLGIIISALIGTYCMISIWLFVCKQDMKNPNQNIRFKQGKSHHQSLRHKQSTSKAVATQALFYLIAFYVTWAMPLTNRAFEFAKGFMPFSLLMAGAVLHPLQGAFNVLVYMRHDFSPLKKTKQTNAQQFDIDFNVKSDENDQEADLVLDIVDKIEIASE